MKLSWVGMTATAIVVGAGAAHAAGDVRHVPGDKGSASIAKRAAAFKVSAWAALGKGDAARAIQDAEAATALLPNDAGMRALLGRAYLAAGRFRSAETAFGDAMTLDPALPRAAVSRSLAQIALGYPDAARETLAKAVGIAADADIGLAQALLGETEAARQRLDAAARAPGADARTRQNLGLALALEGRWTDAVAVAAQDVPADVMPQRLHRWAMIAQLRADPAMQVGAILGVVPVVDAGQPEALALVLPPKVPTLVEPEPLALADAAAPTSVPELIISKVTPEVRIEAGAVVTSIYPKLPSLEALVGTKPLHPPAVSAPEPTALALQAPPVAEPVAAIAALPAPAPPISDSPKPQAWAGPPRMRGIDKPPAARWASAPLAAAAPVRNKAPKTRVILASQITLKPAGAKSLGGWAVQLGAYSSHGRREVAWGKLSARASFLNAYAPTGSGHKVGKVTLYRLSVSGIATRKDAISLCVRIKAAGGDCFVRNMRGDEPMRWALLPKADERV